MNRIFRILFFSLLFGSLFTAFGQSLELPEVPWFDHVTRPTVLTHGALCDYVKLLHQQLKEKTARKKILAACPADSSPRVLFLTLGEGNWPGRCYFAAGYTFKDALDNVLQILESNEPALAERNAKNAAMTIQELKKENKKVPQAWLDRAAEPGRWDWMRLDVVQYSKPFLNFSISRSRIAMTSLVGLTFGPGLGFSFTPDQITGRCLLDRSRHISKKQVVNFISESFNWHAITDWMRFCDIQQNYQISLFETDSYYTNGKESCRLYRGHQLKEKFLTGSEALQLAVACGENLMACSMGSGRISSPNTAWVKDHRLELYAELSLAFSRLARETGDERFTSAARKAMISVEKKLMMTGHQMFIQENERLPEEALQDPRKTVRIRTNALACLAYLALGAEEDLAKAKKIARYIQDQANGLGQFVECVLVENGAPLPSLETGSLLAPHETGALAALALQQSGLKGKAVAVVGETRDRILQQKVDRSTMEEMEKSPWFGELMLASPQKDKLLMARALRLGLAAGADLNYQPGYPDYYASIHRQESCTLSADRSRLLSSLCLILRQCGEEKQADELLGTAMAVMYFQAQGFMDEPSSSSLPSPAAYRGWFRDNLEDYGFDLHGQVTQILSMISYAQLLKAVPEGKSMDLPVEMKAVMKRTDVHPNALLTDLVLTDKQESAEDQRSSQGNIRRGATRQYKDKNFKFPKQTEVSSGVISK